VPSGALAIMLRVPSGWVVAKWTIIASFLVMRGHRSEIFSTCVSRLPTSNALPLESSLPHWLSFSYNQEIELTSTWLTRSKVTTCHESLGPTRLTL
jgi:hypothetical protein